MKSYFGQNILIGLITTEGYFEIQTRLYFTNLGSILLKGSFNGMHPSPYSWPA